MITRFIILAQSPRSAGALRDWLIATTAASIDGEVSCIVHRPEIVGREQRGAFGFNRLALHLDSIIRSNTVGPLNQIAVVVDVIQPMLLNPLSESPDDWNALIAGLILAFPEVKWIFGSIIGESSGFPREDHVLSTIISRPVRDPLLDPTGLRQFVKSLANVALKGLGDDLAIPVRRLKCAAIDEEFSFAYLHGYTGYRFGLNVDIVTSMALGGERFGPQRSHGYWLVFEDMSLNFGDRVGRTSLLRLEDRAKVWLSLDSRDEAVETSALRVLVTTGQTRPGDTALLENEEYLRSKRVGTGRRIFKPAGGMFDLWSRAGLLRAPAEGGRPGNIDGYNWPVEMPQASAAGTGHGSPGKLMLIALFLMSRLRELTGSSSDVYGAVRGAVIATEALELTGGRTPTTAVDALSAKHRLEVLAECQFSGIRHNVDTRARLLEINHDVKLICRWFGDKQKHGAALNAELRVLNEVLRVYREHNCFDEEQGVAVKIRELHNSLWMSESGWRVLAWPFLRYVEGVLSSFPKFLAAVTVWIAVLAVLFYLTSVHGSISYGISDAVSSVFSVGSPIHPTVSGDSMGSAYVAVACLAIVAGSLHLGVLISYIYTLATRK